MGYCHVALSHVYNDKGHFEGEWYVVGGVGCLCKAQSMEGILWGKEKDMGERL